MNFSKWIKLLNLRINRSNLNEKRQNSLFSKTYFFPNSYLPFKRPSLVVLHMGLKVSSSSRAAASLAMSPAANRRRPGKPSDQSHVLVGGTSKYLNKELCTFEASAVLCFQSSCRTLTQYWGWNKGYTNLGGLFFLFVFLATAAYRINKDKRMATILNKPKVHKHSECSQEGLMMNFNLNFLC